MDLFITIIVTFVLSLGLAVLVPLLSMSLAVLSIAGAFFIWLLPTVVFGNS